MITTIIKQAWNKRRANAWIFIELVLAAYFLWSVTDSLYFYTGNYLTPTDTPLTSVMWWTWIMV